MKSIEIYTDGSCLGNPGSGGIGVILSYNKQIKEISRGYFHTTNNRMELLAAITALECLNQPCEVKLFSDSQYLRQGITMWLTNWLKTNWNNGKVKNQDLWQELLQATKKHKIEWRWVKGHSGNVYNERCDILAKQGALNPTIVDCGYQNQ